MRRERELGTLRPLVDDFLQFSRVNLLVTQEATCHEPWIERRRRHPTRRKGTWWSRWRSPRSRRRCRRHQLRAPYRTWRRAGCAGRSGTPAGCSDGSDGSIVAMVQMVQWRTSRSKEVTRRSYACMSCMVHPPLIGYSPDVALLSVSVNSLVRDDGMITCRRIGR